MNYLICRIRDTGVSSAVATILAEAILKANSENLAESGLDSTSRTQTNRRASHIYFSQLSGLETKTPNQKDSWEDTVCRGAASSWILLILLAYLCGGRMWVCELKKKRMRIMEAGRVGGRGTRQHVEAPERIRRCTQRNKNQSHCTGRVGTIKANEAEALFDKITDYNGNEKLSTWCGSSGSIDLAGNSYSTTRSPYKAFYLCWLTFEWAHSRTKLPPLLRKIRSKASPSIL